jgi:hypothetical protein
MTLMERLVRPHMWTIKQFGPASLPRYPFLGGAGWPH